MKLTIFASEQTIQTHSSLKTTGKLQKDSLRFMISDTVLNGSRRKVATVTDCGEIRSAADALEFKTTAVAPVSHCRSALTWRLDSSAAPFTAPTALRRKIRCFGGNASERQWRATPPLGWENILTCWAAVAVAAHKNDRPSEYIPFPATPMCIAAAASHTNQIIHPQKHSPLVSSQPSPTWLPHQLSVAYFFLSLAVSPFSHWFRSLLPAQPDSD